MFSMNPVNLINAIMALYSAELFWNSSWKIALKEKSDNLYWKNCGGDNVFSIRRFHD